MFFHLRQSQVKKDTFAVSVCVSVCLHVCLPESVCTFSLSPSVLHTLLRTRAFVLQFGVLSAPSSEQARLLVHYSMHHDLIRDEDEQYALCPVCLHVLFVSAWVGLCLVFVFRDGRGCCCAERDTCVCVCV